MGVQQITNLVPFKSSKKKKKALGFASQLEFITEQSQGAKGFGTGFQLQLLVRGEKLCSVEQFLRVGILGWLSGTQPCRGVCQAGETPSHCPLAYVGKFGCSGCLHPAHSHGCHARCSFSEAGVRENLLQPARSSF